MTPRVRRRTIRHQRGFALVVVLWTVGILALLIATLVRDAGQESRLTIALRDRAIGRAAADAILSEVTMEMLRTGATVPGPRRFAGVPVEAGVVDLSGRMNPNIASATMIAALLFRLGVWPQAAQNLAAAIVDWRTPGQSPSPHGAKAAEYRAAGLPYGPPGRPFETLDELGSVLGMDRALLAALKPHLTLWSTTDPNPAFAGAVVLGALRVAGAPPFAAPSNEARVIAITATASLPDAPIVTRRAVLRFGYSPDGRGWRVLAWDDGEPAPW